MNIGTADEQIFANKAFEKYMYYTFSLCFLRKYKEFNRPAFSANL